jgi:hypothetical protein
VGEEDLQGRRADAGDLLAVAGAIAGEKVVDQGRQVLAPVAQARHAQEEAAQTIVEVGTEAPGPHLGAQVDPARRQDADVDGARVRRAQGLHQAGVEEARELALAVPREPVDAVEEEGAAVGHPGEALPHFGRLGEHPRHVAEELAVEELLGQPGGVDTDERPAGAPPEAMEGLGDRALAAPRLPLDEDRDVGRGDLLDLVEQLADGRRAADQIAPYGALSLPIRHSRHPPRSLSVHRSSAPVAPGRDRPSELRDFVEEALDLLSGVVDVG